MLRARTNSTMVTQAAPTMSSSSSSSLSRTQSGPSSRRTRSYSHLDFGTEGLEEYINKARSMSFRMNGGEDGGSRGTSLLSSLGLSGSKRRSRLLVKCVAVILCILGALVVLDHLDGEEENTGDLLSRARNASKTLRGGAAHRARLPLHSRKTDFLEEWLRFQGDHPRNGTDRFAFADMGFQTAVYEQAMLSAHQLGETRLREIESGLFPWMHNLHVLRREHVFQHIAESSSTKDAAHHRPINPGIVIVAGDGQFRYAVELINTIRRGHHCDMPIEVYYYGSHDLSTEKQDFLSENFEHVQTVDMSQIDYFVESFVQLKNPSWALKPYAMMASNFTEVMLLDADSILLADPHDFFHQPDYRETGTLLFQDRLALDQKFEEMQTWFRAQLGLRDPSPALGESPFWEQRLRHRGESGLVVLNKSKPGVFATLLFILWQNSGDIRQDMTYQVFYGDKETFWSAFELAGIPYYMSPYWAGAIGPEHAKHLDGFCSDHILHFFDAPVVHNASASTGFGHRRKRKQADLHPHKVISDGIDDAVVTEAVDAGIVAPLAAAEHEVDEHDYVEDDVAAAGSAALRVVEARPAWLNGALRNNKLWDADDGVMDYATSVWTMDGDWEWRDVPGGGKSFCKVNYTSHSLDALSMGSVMKSVLQAGQEADIMMSMYLEG